MTIELDTTLAQAEVLFLSFAQLVADIDRRRAEEESSGPASALRKRRNNQDDAGSRQELSPDEEPARRASSLPTIGENLRELLRNDGHSLNAS